MSLGPRSAPEVTKMTVQTLFGSNETFQIFLTILGIVSSGFLNDELGSNLIIGSGAFNNLVIAAISICSIPAGQVPSCTVLCCTVLYCTVPCTVQVRRIEGRAVFLVTVLFSLFSLSWLLVILGVSSPHKVQC